MKSSQVKREETKSAIIPVIKALDFNKKSPIIDGGYEEPEPLKFP